MPSRQLFATTLLLLLALAVAAPGWAQPARPSHRPIHSGLEEDLRPEDRLNSRLSSIRDLKQLLGEADDLKLDSSFKELAKKLLQDEKFRDTLKGLKPDDIERLKRQFGQGGNKERLLNDPALKELLKGLKGTKLDDGDRDLMRRWAKKFGPIEGPDGGPIDGGPPDGKDGKPPDGKDGQPPIPPRPPDGKGPQPPTPPAEADRRGLEKLLERSEGWLGRNVERWAKDLERWMQGSRGQRLRRGLSDFGKRILELKASVPENWGERTKGLVSWVPRLADTLPTTRVPSMPTIRTPSLGGMPAPPTFSPEAVAGSGKVILGAALLALVAVVAWRLAGGWVTTKWAAAVEGWRLGPWPVRPENVTTCGDLVRAFEHLALLALGQTARTWNHLEVGQRLGEQAALDADRRQEAADRLAHLYEQARYAPEEEPLGRAELDLARRELCYLAGVPSA